METTKRMYKTGYVLMLDVLGFREAVTKNPDLNFFETWSELKKILKARQIAYEKDDRKSIGIDVLCLSDTIIVGLSYKSEDKNKRYDNRYLLSSITRIIDLFLIDFMVKYKTFFRGVIGYGDFWFSEENDIVMGPVIDEVSNWYESCDWIGISLSPSAQYALEYILSVNDKTRHPKALENIKNRFIEYRDLPGKDAVKGICHYAFCWYKREKDASKNKENYEEVLELFSHVKHDPSYANKYYEAAKFLKYCLINCQYPQS